MREPIAELDPAQLIELLHHHSVDYVIVGGYAARAALCSDRRRRRTLTPATPVKPEAPANPQG